MEHGLDSISGQLALWVNELKVSRAFVPSCTSVNQNLGDLGSEHIFCILHISNKYSLGILVNSRSIIELSQSYLTGGH